MCATLTGWSVFLTAYIFRNPPSVRHLFRSSRLHEARIQAGCLAASTHRASVFLFIFLFPRDYVTLALSFKYKDRTMKQV